MPWPGGSVRSRAMFVEDFEGCVLPFGAEVATAYAETYTIR
jgi:hypothetical protein